MTFDRTILSIAALAAAALPSAVFAADMPTPELAPMAMATPTYDWSGFYLGGQIGYGWSRSTTGPIIAYDPFPTVDFTLPGIGINGSGLLGGIEAGYNWQSGHMLFGFEGDVSAAGIKGTYTDAVNNFSVDSTITSLSTLRVRIGLPIDRLLLFASGGLAVAGVKGDLHDNFSGPPVTLNTSSSNMSVGWTIGGGAAVALGNRWTLKGEYLYTDLGSKTYNFAEPLPGDPLVTTTGKTTASIVRMGLDYRF